MKKCAKCGEIKELDNFPKKKKGKNGLLSICRICKLKEDREWRTKHPEKIRALRKKWRTGHPELAKELKKKTNLNQRGALKGKLNNNISGRVRKTLHGSKANRRWESLVGYTIDQLKRHLEKLFKPGMTWENYGTYWHIDHKIPVVVFNFEKPEDIDFRLCWSLKNLQPLERMENLSKRAKINKPFQPSLAIGG